MVDVPVFVVAPEIVVHCTSEKSTSISYTLFLKLNHGILAVSISFKFQIGQYLSCDMTSPITSLLRNYNVLYFFYEGHPINNGNFLICKSSHH